MRETLTLKMLEDQLAEIRKRGFADDDTPVLVSATCYTSEFGLRIEAQGWAKNAGVCNPEQHGPHVRIWGVQ